MSSASAIEILTISSFIVPRLPLMSFGIASFGKASQVVESFPVPFGCTFTRGNAPSALINCDNTLLCICLLRDELRTGNRLGRIGREAAVGLWSRCETRERHHLRTLSIRFRMNLKKDNILSSIFETNN